MLKTEREQEVLQRLRESGHLSVRQLSQQLYTSESTVRRILAQLERKGLVRRSYGGAESVESYNHVAAFRSRAQENRTSKEEIARKAASMVTDGSIVFLDQSTSAYHLAAELRKKKALTVVTNNVEIAALLSQTDFEVYVSGGRLSRQMRMCLVGEDAHRIFHDIHADFAFFSARSLSGDGLVSDCDRDEICVRNAMLNNARCRVFLCDSSKFDSRSGYRQCHLSELDVMVCEKDTGCRFSELLRVL